MIFFPWSDVLLQVKIVNILSLFETPWMLGLEKSISFFKSCVIHMDEKDVIIAAGFLSQPTNRIYVKQ